MWVLREGGKNTKRAFNAWLKTLWEDITTRTLNWATYFCIVKLRTCNTFFYTSPSSDHVFSPPLYSKDCQGVEIKFVFPVFVPRGRLLYVSTRKSEKIGILVKLDPVNYFTAQRRQKQNKKVKLYSQPSHVHLKLKSQKPCFCEKGWLVMSLVSQLFRDHIRANKSDKMFPKKKLDAVNYFPAPAFDTNSPLHISSTNNSPSHRNQTNKKQHLI